MTGWDGSRYSHCLIEPSFASSTTPRRRNAQQSYATDTKKLAGRRLSTPILQPISDVVPPKPIVPMPSTLTVFMIVASSSARTRVRIHVVERAEQLLLGVQRSPRRGRRRCRRRRRPGCSPCPAPARPRAGCTCARPRGRGRRGRGGPVRTGTEYWTLVFSQPPPLSSSLTSISSRSHCSKWMTGVPGPEVVARVLAGDRVDRVRAQLAAAGRLGDGVANLLRHPDLVGADRHLDLEGRACRCPGRSRPRRRRPGRCSAAMMVSACADRVPAGSSPSAAFIAARTSGGRSVDVLTMSSRMLSKNAGNMARV